MSDPVNPFQIAMLILAVLVIFNLIIFVHELGHYWAAKWRGLKIDRFQIWFGKPIWSKTINGVQWGLGWIPAGGFVALPQMAPMEAIEGGNRDSEPLPPIKPLDKIIVAFAGPLFSFLLALVAAVGVSIFGKPADIVPTTTIGWVEPGSPAAKAGLQRDDKIVAVNGTPVSSWEGTLDSVQLNIVTSRGSHIEFTVDRPGQGEVKLNSEFEIPETPKWWQRRAVRNVGIQPIGVGPVTIGIAPEEFVKNPPAGKAGLKDGDTLLSINGQAIVSDDQALFLLKDNGAKPVEIGYEREGTKATATVTPVVPLSPKDDTARPMIGVGLSQELVVNREIIKPGAFEQIGDTVKMMWITITSVIAPDSSIGVQHLSGPIGIGKLQYFMLQMDYPFLRILGFLVLLNINLAILNMMPFPVLDGGHIVLATMEWIAKRPVRVKLLEYIQLCFVFLLFGVMLYVSSKDFFDDFGRGSGKRSEPLVFPAN
jgi:regulator of sigma E protease